MIPTPDLSHLTKADYEHVYEPAEDTFILLDALEEGAEHLRGMKPSVALEIGSGSGCVSAFLGQILGSSSCLYLCTDINRHASFCTQKTGLQNRVTLEAINTSLLGPLALRLGHAVDVLIFNPPYVPTVCEEVEDAQAGRSIQGSWAGGAQGMAVTNKVLEIVAAILSPKGSFYLVAVKDNDIPFIRREMLAKYQLDSEVDILTREFQTGTAIIDFIPTMLDRITTTSRA